MRGYVTLACCLAAAIAGRGQAEDALIPLPLALPHPRYSQQPHPELWVPGPHGEPRSLSPRPVPRVPRGTVNCALHKPVTASSPPFAGDLALVTDGDKECHDGCAVELKPRVQWIQIDLGRLCELYHVYVWHFFEEAVTVHGVIVQVSPDSTFASGVTTLFNNDWEGLAGLGQGTDREYFETHQGRGIPARGVHARYVRLYSRGSNYGDPLNRYQEVEVWGQPVGTAPLPGQRWSGGRYLSAAALTVAPRVVGEQVLVDIADGAAAFGVTGQYNGDGEFQVAADATHPALTVRLSSGEVLVDGRVATLPVAAQPLERRSPRACLVPLNWLATTLGGRVCASGVPDLLVLQRGERVRLLPTKLLPYSRVGLCLTGDPVNVVRAAGALRAALAADGCECVRLAAAADGPAQQLAATLVCRVTDRATMTCTCRDWRGVEVAWKLEKQSNVVERLLSELRNVRLPPVGPIWEQRYLNYRNGLGAVTLPNGLSYEDLQPGDGAEVGLGQQVTIRFAPKLATGEPLGGTWRAGELFTFTIGAPVVIGGLRTGVIGMRPGGRRRLVLPPALGYGSAGAPPLIPADATLVLDVELLSVGR